ncbi:MAG: hypothetical protein MUQ50_03140, partial [Paracoccaceae bacterium]|nr:hypothetical protein [Paracoccaceae bacterium]
YVMACPEDGLTALQKAATVAQVPLSVMGRFGGKTACFGTQCAHFDALANLYKTSFSAAIQV